MKYKLNFVKISDSHQFAGVGFAGNIFITLNALEHTTIDDNMYVDMGTNECVCTENNVDLYDTNNCWEYYFNQNKIEEGEELVELNSLIGPKIHYEDRDMFLSPSNFTNLKNKFYNSFELKQYLKELLEDFYNEKIKGKLTLGVQVRLTDMKHYHNVSPVEHYLTKINSILEEHPEIEQIFLATDDNEVIEFLIKNVNKPIIFYEDMFRADKNNPHTHPYDRFISPRENHRYKLGVECIQEIFTLAKCDYILKADVSSVSIVSIILSENIQKVFKL